MKFKFTVVFLALQLLLLSIAHGQSIFQNIHDTTATEYHWSESNEHPYVPTLFETYIENEVKKSLFSSEKMILGNFR